MDKSGIRMVAKRGTTVDNRTHVGHMTLWVSGAKDVDNDGYTLSI